MYTRKGFTFFELIITLAVLVAISGLLVPLCNEHYASATETATNATLHHVRLAVMDYWRDTKHVELDGVTTHAAEAERFSPDWLFLDPVSNDLTVDYSPTTRIGWNGPYAEPTGFASGTPQLIDAWNRAIVIQYVTPSASVKEVRVVSAGSDGVVDIPAATPTSALTPADVGDDLYVTIMLR